MLKTILCDLWESSSVLWRLSCPWRHLDLNAKQYSSSLRPWKHAMGWVYSAQRWVSTTKIGSYCCLDKCWHVYFWRYCQPWHVNHRLYKRLKIKWFLETKPDERQQHEMAESKAQRHTSSSQTRSHHEPTKKFTGNFWRDEPKERILERCLCL